MYSSSLPQPTQHLQGCRSKRFARAGWQTPRCRQQHNHHPKSEPGVTIPGEGTSVRCSGWCSRGVRIWGAPCTLPVPSVVVLGATARCQSESIFIPCLKISRSGSVAHDGSSLLPLPPGASQLREEEQQAQASHESPLAPFPPYQSTQGTSEHPRCAGNILRQQS